MNGALLNVFGLAQIATDVKEKTVGNTLHFQVQLAEYPPSNSQRERSLVWMELKHRDQQEKPKKGDVISIASATYDVHKVNKDGQTRHYHTLTAYVWRILPAAKMSTASAAPAATAPEPQPVAAENGGGATPPSLGDEDIPF